MLITIDLPYIHSLKGRRKILNSIKDRLSKYNISIADFSGEYSKEAQIGLLFWAKDNSVFQKKIQNIEKVLDRFFSEIEYDISYEVL